MLHRGTGRVVCGLDRRLDHARLGDDGEVDLVAVVTAQLGNKRLLSSPVALSEWMHIIQLREDFSGALSKFLRRRIAKGLWIYDRLQRLVQTHFYARAGQKGCAALREAADRLYALSLDDWTFVARMTGPFAHILKNVAVNRLQVSFVEIALRAVSFSDFLHPHGGRAILFHAQLGMGFNSPSVFQNVRPVWIVRSVGIGVGTFGALISHGEAQQKAASSKQAAFALEG